MTEQSAPPRPPQEARPDTSDSIDNEQRRNHWPNWCPFTKRPFFMGIEHPELGNVPTYGGPFDSYTIPEPDDDGYLHCERYDHDAGEWIEGGDPTCLLVISEREHGRLLENGKDTADALSRRIQDLASDCDTLQAALRTEREGREKAERDARIQRAKVTIIVGWLEANQKDVFSRGLWDALNVPALAHSTGGGE